MLRPDLAIAAQGVSKRYWIPSSGGSPSRFRFRPRRTAFDALSDVSFEVPTGEILGIIGRNGAGKSTLLKLLSRITPPDAGVIEMVGRVGSLLEVGAGFHPELTGRENVFLNGTLLGMSRREIASKFEQIVDFSGVEQFLDLPVKRYSSGMYVRLAFSVAAHLDTEIMLVDEVLAVGDAQFQAKCLSKIRSLAADEGRTLLFVSHSMMPVRSLCHRVMVLDGGRIVFNGDPHQAVATYVERFEKHARQRDGIWDLTSRTNPHPPHTNWFEALELVGADGTPRGSFEVGDPITFKMGLSGSPDFRGGVVGLRISSDVDMPIFTATTTEGHVGPGRREVALHIPELPLTPGTYRIGLGLAFHHGGLLLDEVPYAGSFEVTASGTSDEEWLRLHGDGAVLFDARWI